jgi:hypothetical protein
MCQRQQLPDPESKKMKLLPSGRQAGLANAVKDQVRKREGMRARERERESASE